MAFSLHFRPNTSGVPFYRELADISLSASTDLHFHTPQNLLSFSGLSALSLRKQSVVSFTIVPTGFLSICTSISLW